jgi:uncharacterized membrane protein
MSKLNLFFLLFLYYARIVFSACFDLSPQVTMTTTIEASAFIGCVETKSLTIASTVTSIGKYNNNNNNSNNKKEKNFNYL